ncbi:membrane-associating domain-containing protein [Peziza echinospora]|nr:membrane-associating domain-containing protein [Peziza echinospora]
MASMNPIPILRIVQGVLALITLGLAADVVSFHNSHGFQSPSESNFLVWCSVWTFLALLYLGLAPLFAPNLTNKWGILGVEVLSVIFWFAGWAAQAAYLASVTVCYGTVCGTARASIAFALFSWIAWCITLYMVIVAIRSLNTREEDVEEKLPERRPSQRHRHRDPEEPRRHKSRKHSKRHRSKSHRRRAPSPDSTEDSARVETASPSSDGDTHIVEAVPTDEASRYTKYVHPEPPAAAGGTRMPSAGNYGGRI